MKAVLVMFKDDERRDFQLKNKSTIVGRRPDCGLRIPTKDVSRQHCEVVVTPTEIIARDLGSSNGTYVNGKRIAEAKLAAGDTLSIGPVTFVLQVDGKPTSITPHDAKVERVSSPKPAEVELGEEDLFELDDTDFDLNDDIATVMDEDDDDRPKGKKK